MWTRARPSGGESVGGFPCATPSALACALPCEVVVSGGVAAGVVDAALLSAGTEAGAVDDATVSLVDVATGDLSATGVAAADEATASVDVASTCARTGLTMVDPIATKATTTLAPTNLIILVFITTLG